MSKLGFAALNDNLNQIDVSGLATNLANLGDNIYTGRVLNVILDENSEGFEANGEWNGIGTIEFELVNFQTPRELQRTVAAPLLSNKKHYPLVNELVLIFKLPDTGIGSRTGSEKYYYLNTLSLWNHPHHNAYPNPIQGQQLPDSQNKDYQQVSGGSVRRVTDESTEIDLNGESGGTFVEQTNIHPLLPFAGDIILEGRFGNSIRLGNTSKTDSEYANLWSNTGDNGSPITIIRNGQPEDSSEEGWLPTTENINTDLSSVTLTSTQQIPLEPSNEDYSAFDEAPINAAEFTNNQIILNSGRLYFNSKSDDIILSSAGNVAIQGIKSVGITADQDLTLNSSDVRIGNKSADQQLVLGNDFMVQFESLVQGVSNLCDKLKTAQNWPGGAAVPNVPLIAVAINTKVTAETILNNIKAGKLLSKVSKTI